MEKALLLIDDESVTLSPVLDNISDRLRGDRIHIRALTVNPLDREFWDENKDPNVALIIAGIKRRLSGLKVGLIVIDQFYSEQEFTGLTIIHELRQIPRFALCPIILISGKREKIIEGIFNNPDFNESQKVSELSRIIGYNINRFLDKEFKDVAIEVLKKNSIGDILPSKLREYDGKGFKINLFSPKYSEVALEELADHIDSNSSESFEILNEILELTLSHYAKIDEAL